MGPTTRARITSWNDTCTLKGLIFRFVPYEMRRGADGRCGMVKEENDEKLTYSQFVGLLNVIRSKDLLSAEGRREYDKRWRDHPEQRDLILEDLERINEEHSERLIRDRKRS